MKSYYVYILSNHQQTTLYTGLTHDLVKRLYIHKQGLVAGFSAKYKVDRLVYFEVYSEVEQAILREKQIKAGSRAKKIALIYQSNPEWLDLYERISDG